MIKPIRHPVFVILPLNSPKHVAKVFEAGIAPALRYFGFEAKRVDDQAMQGGIIDAIRRQIADSFFVIADLSFARPNCYYELGYAQAIGKPVLMLTHQKWKPHFDISHQMVHPFTEKTSIETLVKERVPLFLQSAKRKSGDNRNHTFGRHCIVDDFRLCAQVDECTKDECSLTFEVCSLKRERPLKGQVTFFMHESFAARSKTQITKNAVAGIVRYEGVVSSGGPWTLGAEVLETKTRLELDLATIPGAREWWYRKAYKPI